MDKKSETTMSMRPHKTYSWVENQPDRQQQKQGGEDQAFSHQKHVFQIDLAQAAKHFVLQPNLPGAGVPAIHLLDVVTESFSDPGWKRWLFSGKYLAQFLRWT